MTQTKLLLSLLIMLMLSACVKPFTPNIDGAAASKVVVSGRITNVEGFQTIVLSRSIPLNDKVYENLSGCSVSIWDENDHEFVLNEFEEGKYHVWMNGEDLIIGRAYHLIITTPEGEKLVSSPDVLTQVGDVNLPEFKLDSIYNSAYNYYTRGIQLFVDVSGNENTSPYYLFEIDATYEHHAKYAREWYYNGSIHHIYPPDSSLMYCWTTFRVPEIVTLSTENLSANEFNNFPLYFVPLNRDYLTFGYSLLLRQVGLSREAFLYWEMVRLNNNQNADLYSKQPVDTQGNIKNTTNPEKEVLGFFSASAVSETRFFIEPMPTIPLPICAPWPLDRLGLREISRTDYPAFLMNNPLGTYFLIWLPNACVDCSFDHGSIQKPEFWPY